MGWIAMELPARNPSRSTGRDTACRTASLLSSNRTLRAPSCSASRRSSARFLYVKCLIQGAVFGQQCDRKRSHYRDCEHGKQRVLVIAEGPAQKRDEVGKPGLPYGVDR